MKPVCLFAVVLGACTMSAVAQTNQVYSADLSAPKPHQRFKLVDASSLIEPGMADSATKVFGYPGKRMGLDNVSTARAVNMYDIEREARNSRAWGVSVGVKTGPVTFRAAHQNKAVGKIAPAMPLGTSIDAKNTIVAANVDIGPVKAYTAYSASRGWGSSPLWNPDNPYGAAMATTPSTDSRDVLVGMAVPAGRHTTLLASFVRKNDRDLANRDADQFALGGTYTLSRKTDFYAAYSHIRMHNSMDTLLGRGGASSSGFSAINVGMRRSF
ncbi:porin [Massilia sp. CF038]|nr:porin [Massilia sp. CF038]